jgi:hypothetical protein
LDRFTTTWTDGRVDIDVDSPIDAVEDCDFHVAKPKIAYEALEILARTPPLTLLEIHRALHCVHGFAERSVGASQRAFRHERNARNGEDGEADRHCGPVPERDSRANRRSAHHPPRRESVVLEISAPSRYPAPRCVWISGIDPGASIFFRSRLT